jgi:hypothetical protein
MASLQSRCWAVRMPTDFTEALDDGKPCDDALDGDDWAVVVHDVRARRHAVKATPISNLDRMP